MNHKSIRFTTSQFAKLHGLNKRTLHFYDKIGLFSPLYKGENGYRYYGCEQSMELENILMLKELNMSLEEIKQYGNQPNAADFIAIADVKSKEIEEEMKRLKLTKQILERKKRQLDECASAFGGEIKIVELEENLIRKIPYGGEGSDIENFFPCLKQFWSEEQYRIGFGSYIAMDKVRKKQFDEYDGLFAPVRKKGAGSGFVRLPKGSCLCGYSIGEWSLLEGMYTRMLDFADENGLALGGEAYELGLNEFAVSDRGEYVTKIIIPIKEA